MYQLWKNIRRLPQLYDARYISTLTVGYLVFGYFKIQYNQATSGHAEYQKSHTGSYEEERRQYAEKIMLQSREKVNALRQAKLDQMRLEAQQI